MLDLVKLMMEELEDAREEGVYSLSFKLSSIMESGVVSDLQMTVKPFLRYINKYPGKMEVYQSGKNWHFYYKCDQYPKIRLICVATYSEWKETPLEAYVK